MQLRKYCVTVMDNWTPTRTFWTKTGAIDWYSKFIGGAHLYEWRGGFWNEIGLWRERPR